LTFGNPFKLQPLNVTERERHVNAHITVHTHWLQKRDLALILLLLMDFEKHSDVLE